jgi:Response regulator receiver domain
VDDLIASESLNPVDCSGGAEQFKRSDLGQFIATPNAARFPHQLENGSEAQIPRTDGTATLGLIRAKYDIPVISLASKEGVVDEVFALKTGADDFICKPCSHPLLAERVRAVLRRTLPKEQYLRGKPATQSCSAAFCAWTWSAIPAPGKTRGWHSLQANLSC